MKKIVESKTTEYILDLYVKMHDMKKDVNTRLKTMSCAIYKIEKRVDQTDKKIDKLLWTMLGGMGALLLTFIIISFRLIK